MKSGISKLLYVDGIDFEKWHEDTCDSLKKCYLEHDLGKVFSYGNAQKWVNMTLKYLYIFSGISEEYAKEFLGYIIKIKEYKSQLHIPIDSYIIDVLWNEGVEGLPLKENITINRNKEYSVPSEYVKGWSLWNKEEYQTVCKGIRSMFESHNYDLSPIDWEIDRWIKRAKERRNK